MTNPDLPARLMVLLVLNVYRICAGFSVVEFIKQGYWPLAVIVIVAVVLEVLADIALQIRQRA